MRLKAISAKSANNATKSRNITPKYPQIFLHETSGNNRDWLQAVRDEK